MATTENYVFGNGGNTYSFSFPYLKTEDVRVEFQEFDSTQTPGNQIISRSQNTAFTIPPGNPTTIVFDAIGASTTYQTSPNGNVRVTSTNGYPVRIRIYRATQADATPATFFAGSAIRAQDLNDNFDQILYIMQEKENALLSIQTGGIGDNVIATSALQDDSVDASKLRDSVSTDADRAVTTNHIRDNAVTSAKIANDTIVDADINSAAAIAPSKLGTGVLPTTITVASANIVDGTIVDGDISASAEIAVSKLADGTARQLLQTDAAGTGVEWTSNVDVPGTLDVTGAATFDSTITTTGAATFSSTVTATGNVTVPSLNGGPLAGARNILINGDTRIDQRNAGVAVTLNNSNNYPCDRWVAAALGGLGTGTATAQRVVDAPAGFTTSLKWTTTNAKTPAAADSFYVWQPIEGHNIDHIGFNTASAKPLTLSFWVKSSLTGTFSGFCRQTSSALTSRSYVFTYTISSTNTWEYKTVSIAADPSSGFTPNLDSNTGLGVLFDLGSGSTSETGTTGAWQSGDYYRSTGSVRVISTLNATWQVTGVQLETGSVATPFERRSYGQELALCQRYYQKGVGVLYPSAVPAVAYFPVVMRAIPSVTTISIDSGTGGTWTALSSGAVYQPTFNSAVSGSTYAASAEF